MSATEHGFKAEVQQLLDLMIHSVYSERDVFLRELVSNAADALDKVRFLEVTRDDLLAPSSDELGIRITVDEDAKVITIEDDGVGMTEEEAIRNLGTIAHSGSRDFLEQAKSEKKKSDDAPAFIGQFGVGFYSSFMVAGEVQVETRSALPDSHGIRWTSNGTGTYTIEPMEKAERGTRITLFLRDDADEFAKESRLQQIIKHHSDYLVWPITLGDNQANSATAIWLTNPADVTDTEANTFYKGISHDWQNPALRIHTRVDTPLQYAAMLFVPRNRPHDLLYPEANRGPRLYARRVMIVEHARSLLPDWLRFVKGVVDSEDISLNVSREMIQKTPVVQKIRDHLTRKILKELQAMAKNEARAAEEESEDTAEPTPDADADVEPTEPKVTYSDLWREFGICLKEGYYHDSAKWEKLLQPLLRFNTMNGEDDELVSLQDYVDAMPEDQDTIWYLAMDSRGTALASPHLEAAKERNWNVILLTDPVDEWLTQVLSEFGGTPLKSIARGEIELEDEDEKPDDHADLSELAPWLNELYGDDIKSVRASGRLTNSPCVLVDEDSGISANMERLMRAANQQIWSAQRHLELNTRHPIVRNLAALHRDGHTDRATTVGRLLLDNALLMEGTVTDAQAIGRRLQDMLTQMSATPTENAPPPESS